jgi:hypothetical protein
MEITYEPEASNDAMPKYGNKPKKPGLYLGLFHGRNLPTEVMSDWGFYGPLIGPLKWCHTTYARDIKLEFETAADASGYSGASSCQLDLEMDGDLLKFGGKYFGDWTLYYVAPEECERPNDSFRKTTRVNDLLAHRRFFL